MRPRNQYYFAIVFPVLHKVGIFVLLKFENMMETEISHFDYNLCQLLIVA